MGADLRRQRIEGGATMLDLAARANISVGALRNLEQGRGATTGTLIRVVRALDRTDWLEGLSPEASVSPIELLREQDRARPRQRARKVK